MRAMGPGSAGLYWPQSEEVATTCSSSSRSDDAVQRSAAEGTVPQARVRRSGLEGSPSSCRRVAIYQIPPSVVRGAHRRPQSQCSGRRQRRGEMWRSREVSASRTSALSLLTPRKEAGALCKLAGVWPSSDGSSASAVPSASVLSLSAKQPFLAATLSHPSP
ncbi:hypothetical protein BCR34DRAFT_14184 [Clohesyomyces aquaticus]|uniref:Uncharacterized protein n=1 Tax=Clohesyomyces aquaticus TaxID=1231657 RepID=A0A1Y1ZDB5_9PLEO|nr:hypothetical protein BCR34DRAFT_14184 [Clohesyomyces aquaticus]